MSFNRLLNEEWLIFISLFSDEQLLKLVRKRLKVIDAEHFCKIGQGENIEAKDVAREFREIIWPIISLVVARLETDRQFCERFGVKPFSIKQARKFFNCLTLSNWRNLGKSIQDEFVIVALKKMFSHMETGADFKHLPEGLRDILKLSKGYSERDTKIKAQLLLSRIISKVKLWFIDHFG